MPAKVLTRTPGSDRHRQIFQCASGCVHLTFDSVTLNFPSMPAVEPRYRNITIDLAREDAQALGQLLEEREFLLLGIPKQPTRGQKEEAHS